MKDAIIGVVVAVIFALLMAAVLVEWMVGCGETYVDAYGQRHMFECVFLPFKQEAK
jgi:hypothetical protein